MREVALDRASRDEQLLGNLRIGVPLSGQLSDAALARGERFEPGQQDASRLGPRGSQLDLGLVGERLSADAVRCIDCLAQEVSCIDPAVASTEEGTEVS